MLRTTVLFLFLSVFVCAVGRADSARSGSSDAPTGLAVAGERTTTPITFKVGTFNTLHSFNGTFVDDQYQAEPANVATTIAKINELQLDLVGLQEVHDSSALQTVANGTGMALAEARSHVWYIYPTAVLSGYPILSRATYNTDGVVRLMSEAEVQMPDGTSVFVFSIHLSIEEWRLVHAHPTRRALLQRLSRGEARVTDLARPFAISLNSVSKHIRRLERAGLVQRRRSGREHILSLNPKPLDEAVVWMERQRVLWTARLDALDELLRAEETEAPPGTRKKGRSR